MTKGQMCPNVGYHSLSFGKTDKGNCNSDDISDLCLRSSVPHLAQIPLNLWQRTPTQMNWYQNYTVIMVFNPKNFICRACGQIYWRVWKFLALPTLCANLQRSSFCTLNIFLIIVDISLTHRERHHNNKPDKLQSSIPFKKNSKRARDNFKTGVISQFGAQFLSNLTSIQKHKYIVFIKGK